MPPRHQGSFRPERSTTLPAEPAAVSFRVPRGRRTARALGWRSAPPSDAAWWPATSRWRCRTHNLRRRSTGDVRRPSWSPDHPVTLFTYNPCVPGRIVEEDIAAVRERARVEDVIGSYVALRNAGGGSLKGLCPFHDEKTPSFQVTPSRGLWYCFGACAEGGDVINFLQKIDNLSFTEAVERLADRVGLQLRHTEDHGHRAEPGFDRAAAERFGVGFAPREGRALLQHLRGRGFSNKELIAAGLARESG